MHLPRVLLLFVLLLLACVFHSGVDAMLHLPLQTGGQSRPVSLAPGPKYAYVSLHYEGTPNDDAYVLALRTWIQSIRLSGTSHDIVILCSDNVSEESKNSFRTLGAIVQIMPNIPNPYKESMTMRRTYKPRFEFTFNKLYLWQMTDYDRVIYMDADNIVLYNIDELFLCGHFCAIFMNMVYFHSGLLVVKPSLHKFNSMNGRLQNLTVYSYDGADQGFFVEEFKNLEEAPLFHLDMIRNGKPLEHPEMRIPLEYNVNHLYFHLTYTWDAWRSMGHYFSDHEIPALSIAFPVAAAMKPWYWYGTAFFNPYWIWQSFRSTLPGEEYWLQVWFPLNVLYFILLSTFCRWFSDYAYRSPRVAQLRTVLRGGMIRLPLTVVKVLGYLLGFFICFYLGPKFAVYFIPSLAPAKLAWLVFIPFRLVFIYTMLHACTAAVLEMPSSSSSSAVGSPSFVSTRRAGALVIPKGLMFVNPPPFTVKSMIPALVMECMCLMLGATYSLYVWLGVTFVGKAAIVVCLLFTVVCAEIHMFACALEVAYLGLTQQQQHRHGGHFGTLTNDDSRLYPDDDDDRSDDE